MAANQTKTTTDRDNQAPRPDVSQEPSSTKVHPSGDSPKRHGDPLADTYQPDSKQKSS